MDTPQELYDVTYNTYVDQMSNLDVESDEAEKAAKTLKLLTESRPTPIAEAEPTTKWGKFKRGCAKALDNETARVTIKALGSLGGVGLVVWTTVYRDHVLERQAMNQANQTPR
jgi:hypothetical protein